MPICDLCGSPLEAGCPCPYDQPEESAPWRGDYDAMNQGLMTHDQHTLVVARWVLHNRDMQSGKALERFRRLATASWGAPLTLFLLTD